MLPAARIVGFKAQAHQQALRPVPPVMANDSGEVEPECDRFCLVAYQILTFT